MPHLIRITLSIQRENLVSTGRVKSRTRNTPESNTRNDTTVFFPIYRQSVIGEISPYIT